jgi:hypothetical protein
VTSTVLPRLVSSIAGAGFWRNSLIPTVIMIYSIDHLVWVDQALWEVIFCQRLSRAVGGTATGFERASPQYRRSARPVRRARHWGQKDWLDSESPTSATPTESSQAPTVSA